MTRKLLNGLGSSPDYPKWMGFNVLQDQAFPASAAACTAIGAITAGTGFTSIGTVAIAPTGGTLTAGVSPADPAQVIPTSIKCVTATVASAAAAGAAVALNDTFTATGGTLAAAGPYGNGTTTAGALTKLTVNALQVVSAVVNAGGSGGTPGAVTVTGTTGTGTKWQGTGTISSGGALTGPIVVTVNGDYSATPTIAGDTVSGGSLSGATCTLVMGAYSFTITVAGGYTTAPALTNLMTALSSSATTNPTATLVYGLGTALLTHSGNYSGAPTFTVTDSAAGTGASIASATLGGSGAAIPRFITDTSASQGANTFPASYGVLLTANDQQLAEAWTLLKTPAGFSVALAGATTLAAGTFDAMLFS